MTYLAACNNLSAAEIAMCMLENMLATIELLPRRVVMDAIRRRESA